MKKEYVALSFAIFLLCACQEKKALPSLTQLALGTVCSVNAYESGTKELYSQITAKLTQIEQKMSTTIEDSELSRINRNAGKKAVAVSDDTFYVISMALKYAEKSGGIFDPTIGVMVKIWDINGENPHVPLQSKIDAALALIDYKKVLLDDTQKTVFLTEEGMALDVGGIAKGFAADEVKKILIENNIPRAIIDLGGNIYAFGSRKDGSAWRVGIKDPDAPENKPAIRIQVHNKSVVTSGVYERFFEQDGVRYHHILDTKTGYPVQNAVLSFTIIAESSLLADVLSTTAFILGEKAGLDFLEKEMVEGFCITADKIVYASKNITDTWDIISTAYHLP